MAICLTCPVKYHYYSDRHFDCAIVGVTVDGVILEGAFTNIREAGAAHPFARVGIHDYIHILHQLILFAEAILCMFYIHMSSKINSWQTNLGEGSNIPSWRNGKISLPTSLLVASWD